MLCAVAAVSSTYFLRAASLSDVGAPSPVTRPVPIAILPDIVPPARGSLFPIAVAIPVIPSTLSPSAAANSFNVFSASGAESTRFATAVAILAVTVFPEVPSTVRSPIKSSV